MTHRTCSKPGCDRTHAAKGLCNFHYRRAIRAGKLKAPRSKASHGTVAMYRNYACRCDECRKANTGFMKTGLYSVEDQERLYRLCERLDISIASFVEQAVLEAVAFAEYDKRASA